MEAFIFLIALSIIWAIWNHVAVKRRQRKGQKPRSCCLLFFY